MILYFSASSNVFSISTEINLTGIAFTARNVAKAPLLVSCFRLTIAVKINGVRKSMGQYRLIASVDDSTATFHPLPTRH